MARRVAVLLLAALLVTGCGGATAPTATRPAGGESAAAGATIGPAGSAANWQITAIGFEKPGKLLWAQTTAASQATGTWVVPAVEVKNTGAQPQAIPAADFTLRDSAGETAHVTSDPGALAYSTSKGGQAVGEPVPPGGVARFYLPFDVSPRATGFTLVFTAGQEFDFDLGQ